VAAKKSPPVCRSKKGPKILYTCSTDLKTRKKVKRKKKGNGSSWDQKSCIICPGDTKIFPAALKKRPRYVSILRTYLKNRLGGKR
jgi:hypothetical protein